jgi:serine/threonine protein phosphatase PrpC
MSITIKMRQPIGMSERGKRANNEDSIYPLEPQTTDGLFIVCDGVGGAAKGNIASRLVCDTFAQLFEENQISDPSFIDSCLLKVEEAVEQYTIAHPESMGMATTLTLVHLHPNGITVAHVGDSRIYHIRNGQILYRSEDHSFVQDLVRTGIITPEEAATHPRRNVITRAIQGKQHPTKADVYVLQDIQADDYFFLCSDGVLESVKDATLCPILAENGDNAEKIQTIKERCQAHSRDNFSCYLIQIEASTGDVDQPLPQPPVWVNPIKSQRALDSTIQPVDTPPPASIGTSPYAPYRSDSVTVITPQQASKSGKTGTSTYQPDAVTVITPAQAFKTNEQSADKVAASQDSKIETAKPPKRNFILFLLIALLMIAGIIWLFFKNNNY